MQSTCIPMNSRNTQLRPSKVSPIYRKTNDNNSAFTSSTSTQMKSMKDNRFEDSENTRRKTIRNSNTKKKFIITCSHSQLACCLCLIIIFALLISVAIASILAFVLPHTTTLSTSTTTVTTATST
ncbi:unnamed protein product, partial [Adineta ricciae]